MNSTHQDENLVQVHCCPDRLYGKGVRMQGRGPYVFRARIGALLSSQLVTVASFTYTGIKISDTVVAGAHKTTVQSGCCRVEAHLVARGVLSSRACGKEKA